MKRKYKLPNDDSSWLIAFSMFRSLLPVFITPVPAFKRDFLELFSTRTAVSHLSIPELLASIYNDWTRRVGITRRVHSWHPQPPLGFVINSASSYELVEFTWFYPYLLKFESWSASSLSTRFLLQNLTFSPPSNPPFVCSKLKTITKYNLAYFCLKQV